VPEHLLDHLDIGADAIAAVPEQVAVRPEAASSKLDLEVASVKARLICLIRRHQWHNGWDEERHLTVWTCKRCGKTKDGDSRNAGDERAQMGLLPWGGVVVQGGGDVGGGGDGGGA